MSAFMAPPSRYSIVESNDAVPGMRYALRTRYRWRAERRVRKLNAQREIQSYHWRALWWDGRWEVRAFQNYLVALS